MSAFKFLSPVLFLFFGLTVFGGQSTNSAMPFPYRFTQSNRSDLPTFILRLERPVDREITATCILTRNGKLAGRFPLRLTEYTDKKNKRWLQFSVSCLANDLVDGAKIELYVRNTETDKLEAYALALKAAKKVNS
jgi:hypothetical protein